MTVIKNSPRITKIAFLGLVVIGCILALFYYILFSRTNYEQSGSTTTSVPTTPITNTNQQNDNEPLNNSRVLQDCLNNASNSEANASIIDENREVCYDKFYGNKSSER